MRQDSPRLLRREDHGQLSRALDALDVVDEVQFAGEHLLVKKEQCSKGLVLCRCSNVFLGSQVREELGNLAFAHLFLRQYDKSIVYLDQALTIAREVKDREFEGTVLSNLMIYWRAFQRPPNPRRLREALQSRRRL